MAICNSYNIPFYLDNVLVEYKDKAVHLGHTIGPKVHTEVIKDMSVGVPCS